MKALRQTHEVFIREFIKNGGNGAQAWRDMTVQLKRPPLTNKLSYKAIAYEALKRPEVKKRYEEIQRKMAKRADITEDAILSKYQEAYDLAKTEVKPETMVSAATAQAKLVGLLRDRIETGEAGDFDKMENISEILEAVAAQAGPEAALALSKAFGLESSINPPKGLIEASNEATEADLADARPASDSVN